MNASRFAFAALVAAAPLAALFAAPAELQIKYGTLIAEKPATAEEIAAVKAAYLAEKKSSSRPVAIQLKESVDDATLAAVVAAFPDAAEVRIDGKKGVTSLAPLAALKGTLRKLEARNIRPLDLAPLAGATALEKADFMYSKIDDLSPLASCPAIREVNVYGAELKDFSPLAACPKLECVNFYAAKLTPEGYATLGALKNVKKFHGGLTKMTSLAWLAGVPQTEELKVFAEKIDDFSPIATLSRLTYFRAWNMSGDSLSSALGDLAFLKDATALKTLELPGSSYSDLEALSGLAALEKLDLSESNCAVDFNFAKNLPSLRTLIVSGRRGRSAKPREVVNLEALAACPKLERLELVNVTATSLAPLMDSPKLSSVTVSKGAFSAEEIAALTAKMKTHAKNARVTER